MKRTLAWVAIALMVGGTATWWVFQGRTAPWHAALSSREIATRVLAEHLVQRFPTARMLVIGNPFTLRSGQSAEIYAFEKASVRGLEAGLGSPERIKVVHPELRPEFLERPDTVWVDPNTTTPLSYLVAENAFDQLAQANPGFDLIVSLVGLPLHVRESKIWQVSAQKRFGLLLPDWRMIGGAEAVREAVTSEKIVAAVVSRPGSAPDDEPVAPKDYRAEFERRFILVTKDNIAELLQTYPQLF
jgi:hypothetical protein